VMVTPDPAAGLAIKEAKAVAEAPGLGVRVSAFAPYMIVTAPVVGLPVNVPVSQAYVGLLAVMAKLSIDMELTPEVGMLLVTTVPVAIMLGVTLDSSAKAGTSTPAQPAIENPESKTLLRAERRRRRAKVTSRRRLKL
jgi:hypothetical protein